ncbi:hypothetical protein IDH44_04280, partial [Paenibacillus sp. IB182496]
AASTPAPAAAAPSMVPRTATAARLELVWDGLEPDRRYARYRGDEAAQAYIEPDGMLPFAVLPFDSWRSWHRCKTAAFTDTQRGVTAGVFAADAAQWQDGEYALWRSSDTLALRFRFQVPTASSASQAEAFPPALQSGAPARSGATGDAGAGGWIGATGDMGEAIPRLSWIYPLASGSRSTIVALYAEADEPRASGAAPGGQRADFESRIDELYLWHAYLPLDKVKDWVLAWDEPREAYPRLFDPGALPEPTHWWYFTRHGRPQPSDIDAMLDELSYSFNRPVDSAPVSSREFASWLPMLDLAAADMTPEQFRRAQAASAMMAYMREDENLMPTRTMLAGHPNFLADIKAVPGYMAALFPNHPHAARWIADVEQSFALNLKYHTRPSVEAWGAEGGRWTENLGCYVWAALVPLVRTAWVLRRAHGADVLLHPNLRALGRYLLGTLSAPLSGGRSYPPQGAHSGVHDDPQHPPYVLRVLGELLLRYDPLLGEQLLSVCPVDSKGFESSGGDVWRQMLSGPQRDNTGTPPQLRSRKFTGYGYVLRGAANTPSELSVYLQQIDEGPNYRWGRASDGGNGNIYYYAEGKRYSYNRPEDVGDDNMGTGEGSTSFGVLCGHEYRGIGRNELTVPLQTLGCAQYAKLLAGPQGGRGYRSRSVILSGNDYIVIYDEVADMRVKGRFSWFNHKDDPMPGIYQIKPGAPAAAVVPAAPIDHAPMLPGTYRGRGSNGYPDGSRGVYYDGQGDFLTIVTHRERWQPQVIDVRRTSYGAIVELGSRIDHVFRDASPIRHADRDGLCFDGRAGIVRMYGQSRFEAALLEGTRIGAGGVIAELLPARLDSAGDWSAEGDAAAQSGAVSPDDSVQAAVSETSWGGERHAAGIELSSNRAVRAASTKASLNQAVYAAGTKTAPGGFAFECAGGRLHGRSSSPSPLRVRLTLPPLLRDESYRLVADGADVPFERRSEPEGAVVFELPAGDCRWAWTDSAATPAATSFAGSESASGAVRLHWAEAAGASGYAVALSRDGGRSWQPAWEGGGCSCELSGLADGVKLHARVRAVHGDAAGEWSAPYPVCPTADAPPAPEGLRLARTDRGIRASWGEVLGAGRYRLYRSVDGTDGETLVYEGTARAYEDNDAAAPAPVCRYRISACNGNGEGPSSAARNTERGGAIDWDPRPGEGFRRYIRSHEYGFDGFDYWANAALGALLPYPR